jgi:uncharacterized protein YjiK
MANVVFGASTTGQTFDNAAAANNATISTLSVVGTNGGFVAANAPGEIGSPGTIANPPLPVVTIAATDAAAAETGPDAGTFTISRTGATTAGLVVKYTVAAGPGKAGAADYNETLSGMVTIPAGQPTVTITITPVNDILVEGTEGVTLSLTADAAYSLGANVSGNISIADNDGAAGIDLTKYVRIGRYDLPEPTRTTPPANSVLAQEVSGVTFNWDTETLFVVGDGGTSVVEVSKTGQLISSMTLATGSSPQNTEFYDPEGITYIGNNQFVMTEERDRNAVLFTYQAGTTLTRANAKTVKLGTFVQNIGLEGLSWDPSTNEYIFVKEITPKGVFKTSIDFNAGTASNGSASTVNSVDLFNPDLTLMNDFADVFALSNLPGLTGSTDFNNLLILSQEDAKIINIDRSGNISSSLTILSDPGNPLNVASQQHEGLTMDRNGILYVVSENGGGTFDHPQLWVYAPTAVPNQPPTSLSLLNPVTNIPENTPVATPLKVADIVVADDGLGTNVYSLTGADASFFEISGTSLFVKAGTILDFEIKNSYSITIRVDDASVGSTPDATVAYTLTVTNVEPETQVLSPVIISEVAPWSSGNSPVAADWFELTNVGTSVLNINGWKIDDGSASFASSAALSGVTTIAPGESVIFIETNNLATTKTAFLNNWFGSNVPAGLQVGNYTGGGLGLSTGGDGVTIFDAIGNQIAKVTFGSSPAGPYPTFDNSIGLNNATISQLSAVGVNSAFVAVNSASETGSPGTIGKLFISEVAPWSSGNSAVAGDWFEVTNTRPTAIDISGWKMDDNSQSPAGAVALNGVTTIGAGESVIFIETSTPLTTVPLFISTWFGTNVPAGLKIGTYTGGGVGLGTGGDAVYLYSAAGVLQTGITFGASPAGPFPTFENPNGLSGVAITQLSVDGVNGAFKATANANEIGSPGRISCNGIAPPAPVVSVSVVCGTATLSTPETFSLLWSTGETTPFIRVTNPGTYTVTTRANFCRSAAGTATITSGQLTPCTIPVVWYRDGDNDNFGNAAQTRLATARPAGYVAQAGDCKDWDNTIYPGAPELGDGKDNDCDGLVDEELACRKIWYLDGDGDGIGRNSTTRMSCVKPSNYVAVGGDCNDQNATINPNATELADGKDNDCNGQIDDGLTCLTTWYIDRDGDGFGSPSLSRLSCIQPANYVSNSSDCNDQRANVYPGAPEICDGFDNDCNGVKDDNCTPLVTENQKPLNSAKPLVKANATTPEVTVYPNPARDEIVVTINGFEAGKKVEMQMTQVDGKAVMAKNLVPSVHNEQVRLDVRGLSSGFYLLQVKQGINQQTKKVMIVR